MSTPQSIINVCSGVRLDNRYEHSIYFPNRTSQESYFAEKVDMTFSAYSYLRKSWPLTVAATMEQAKTWNYLYFQNGTGKTYYYFITNIEYKNDSAVELSLELDVLQTYLFDFEMLDCFVERQHTETDALGEHTLDEGLELGELIDNGYEQWESLRDLCILVLASINPNYADTEKPVQALGGKYDGVFSGLKVWAVNYGDWAAWSAKLDDLTAAGFVDGIISMWMYPKAAVKLGGENTWSDGVLCKVVDGCIFANATYTLSGRPDDLGGYTGIKNKKLLSYPFSFVYATNNCGGSAVYRYERFDEDPTFTVKGCISPEAVIKMYPMGYNGFASHWANYEQGLTLTGFPSCAWDADVYKLWLAQNQNQHQLTDTMSTLSMIGGAASAVASIATGNFMGALGGAGGVIGGASQIASLMAQKRDMAIQPPQSRGSFSGNVNIVAGYNTFSFYHKSVDAYHAKIIDDYFTMYGYKLNSVQKPNLCARKAFTYIKTVGCHIQGNMCTEDIVKVESIFDKGITFWRNGDRIADYSQDNTV